MIWLLVSISQFVIDHIYLQRMVVVTIYSVSAGAIVKEVYHS